MMWRIAMVAGVALASGGCSVSSGVASNQNPGGQNVRNETGAPLPRGKFAYAYYPDVEAYYSADRGQWYWVDPQEGWRFDRELPADLKARVGHAIQLNLDCEHPNDRHAAVVASYPPGMYQGGSTHVNTDN